MNYVTTFVLVQHVTWLTQSNIFTVIQSSVNVYTSIL